MRNKKFTSQKAAEEHAYQKSFGSRTHELESDDHKGDNDSQGLNKLVLTIVEYRAMIYALQKVETKNNPFQDHLFHSQWLCGSAYAIFSMFGKLLGTGHTENSLRQLWFDIQLMMVESKGCEKNENDKINKILNSKEGELCSRNSCSLRFRHQVIAHNENLHMLSWDKFDNEFKTIIRIWSIIVGWCSFGIVDPFSSTEFAFSGLKDQFTDSEIAQLAKKRSEFLAQIELWSKTSLWDGTIDKYRCAFARVSVQISRN